MANSIIYSGGEGSWSNTIIYSGPTTSANIIYNNKNTNWAIYNNILNLKNWAKYNSINAPNNRVGGVQYTNKWANIKYNSGYTGEYIHNKLKNKWANINTLNNKVGGLINNWTIKYIRGANSVLNLINRWNVKYINNKIKWAIYNLKNINNKGIRIGLTHNIKLNNLINKMGHWPLKNNI